MKFDLSGGNGTPAQITSMPWDSVQGGGWVYTPIDQWANTQLPALFASGDPIARNTFGGADSFDAKLASQRAAYDADPTHSMENSPALPFSATGNASDYGITWTPEQIQKFVAPVSQFTEWGTPNPFYGSVAKKAAPYGSAYVTGPDGQSYIRDNPSMLQTFTDKDNGLLTGNSQILGNLMASLGTFGMAGAAAGGLGGASELGNVASQFGDYGGVTGLGALDTGVGPAGMDVGGSTGGLGVGANPIGGNMDLSSLFDPTADFGSDYFSGASDYAGSPLRNLSPGPAGTNLQDLITKFDSLPPGAGTAAKTALGRILNGGATTADYASLAGLLGSTALGVYGANQQQNSLSNLAQQYMGLGAPYRAGLAASYADPASFLANSPDIQAAVGQGTSALGRALSAQGGNPAASGRPLQEMQNYATQQLYGQLGNERQRLANFGGLSALTGAAPQTNLASIQGQGNVYNALGYGLDQLTRPQNSLADLARAFGIQGLA